MGRAACTRRERPSRLSPGHRHRAGSASSRSFSGVRLRLPRAASRVALVALLSLAGAASFTAEAKTVVVERPDGSVAVTIEDEVVTISASLASDFIDVVKENAVDPPRLREAISTLVADNAGGEGEDDERLALAIGAFAAFLSGGDAKVVKAIVEGVLEGRPTLLTKDVLAALPLATPGDAGEPPSVDPPPPRQRQPSDARGTAENPQQLSPS